MKLLLLALMMALSLWMTLSLAHAGEHYRLLESVDASRNKSCFLEGPSQKGPFCFIRQGQMFLCFLLWGKYRRGK